MTKSKSPRASSKPFATNTILRSALPVIAAAVAFRFLLPYLNTARTWGLDYLYYLPIEIAIALSLIVVVPLLPVVARAVANFSEGSAGKGIVIFWLCAALVVAVVLVFPMETFFYGDGGILFPQIYRYAETGAYQTDVILNLKSAPLTGLLLDILFRTIPLVTPTFPFVALSLFAFVTLVFGVFFLYRKDAGNPVSILLLFLGTAGALLFFGYVEFYVLPFALGILFFLAAQRFLEGKVSIWAPVILFVFAVAAHYSNLALAPAVIYLFILHFRSSIKATHSTRAIIIALLAFLVVGIAGYFLFGFADSDSRIVMPLVAQESSAGVQAYTLLSSMHVADFLNLFLLLAPVQLVLLAVLLSRKDAAGFRNSDAFRFYVIALFFYASYLFFANASLGLARDWDMAAFLGIIITAFFFGALRAMPERSVALLPATALAAIAFAIPWLLVNLNAGSSAARFEQVLKLDDKNMYADYALSGYEALRKHYLHENDKTKEQEILRAMIDRLGYAEHYRLLLQSSLETAKEKPTGFADNIHWALGKLIDKAQELKRKNVDVDYSISMKQIDSLTNMITYHAYMQLQYDRIAAYVEAISRITGNPVPQQMTEGFDAFKSNDMLRAAAALGDVMAKGFAPEKVYGIRVHALVRLDEFALADSLLREGMNNFPADGNIPFMAGLAYWEKGNTERGRTLLEKASKLNPPPEVAEAIQNVLGRK